MSIPFSRTIEDILAALPTQAGLEKRVRELGAEIERLSAENAALKVRIEELTPKTGWDANAIKVLKILYELDEHDEGPATEKMLVFLTDLRMGVVRYHLDELAKQGMVYAPVESDDGYHILPPGRAFIIRQGLL